jgi:hypothetical protein
MSKKVLGRSPWRWPILLVGLFFAALPLFMMFPWKDWYLDTVPDALFMVAFPVLIILFGMWIAITALRSGLVIDGERLVNIPYMGIPRKVRIADISAVGAELGHNISAPTVTTTDGTRFLLTGVAHTPTDHGYFRARALAQHIATDLAVPFEEVNPGT